MSIEGNLPQKNIPKIWGDFNAIGLSGEQGDICIYSLHRDELSALGAKDGKLVFVYDDDVDEDDQPEIFGYVCTLEKVEWATGGWRARPDEATWYRGPKFWNEENDL